MSIIEAVFLFFICAVVGAIVSGIGLWLTEFKGGP